MAAFNAEAFIVPTIESALAQEMSDFEFIVMDDGSTDRTSEKVEKLGDPRIRLYRQENAGPSAARNAAIREARAELIALLDHDDFWFPSRLGTLIEHLDRSPTIGFVSSDMYIGHPADPHPLGQILANPSCLGRSIPDPAAWARGCGFSASTALVRRSLFERHGGYDESLLYVQDWELMLRFWIRGEQATMLPEPLGWTVMRPGQLSTNVWGNFHERRKVLTNVLGLTNLPHGFRSAAAGELRSQESELAQVLLSDALAQARGALRALRRESIWAARYHMQGRARVGALVAAMWPVGARFLEHGIRPAIVRLLSRDFAMRPDPRMFDKPRDDFPAVTDNHRAANPPGGL